MYLKLVFKILEYFKVVPGGKCPVELGALGAGGGGRGAPLPVGGLFLTPWPWCRQHVHASRPRNVKMDFVLLSAVLRGGGGGL